MMTITVTVETPEEAAKVVALVGKSGVKQAVLQAPEPAPVGRIGFRHSPPSPPFEDAEVIPQSVYEKCHGDGE